MSDNSHPTPVLPAYRQAIYNPGRLTDSEVKASFIARQGLLALLMEDIDGTRPGSIPQHHLVIGQRGMGKTTLLRRIDVALREPPRSAHYVPLRFPEEQWTLDRLSKLWLNCLDSLADTLEREGGASLIVQKIDAAVDRLSHEQEKEDLLAESAEKAFLELAAQVKRRPVLLVDNLDFVFDRLKPHENNRFRAWLMRPDAPILVGASISPPSATTNYGAPFYDQFKTHYLDRLSLEEMREVLLQLAVGAGNTEIPARLDAEQPRLKTLHALTGGNPRTTVILFQIFTKGFSAEAYQDLEALLDWTTPLYKARFEELPPQAQVLVSALATNWEPTTAAKLCELTHLENKQVSPQLDRLKKAGVIEEMVVDPEDRVGPLPEGRSPQSRTGYQLAERFFNIWFLMRQATRRDRRSLAFLTRFIECVHTPAERGVMARDLLSRRSLSREERIYGLALEPAVTDNALRYELHDYVQQEIVEASRALQVKVGELIDLAEIPRHIFDFAELKEKLESAVPSESGITPNEFAATILGSPTLIEQRNAIANQTLTADKARELVAAAQQDAALSERIAGREAAQWLQNLLRHGTIVDFSSPEHVSAAFHRANTPEKARLCKYHAKVEATRSLDTEAWEVAHKFLCPAGESADDWGKWGRLLWSDFHRLAEAESSCRKAIEFDPQCASAWAGLGLLLADLGRYADSEDAFRKAIQYDPCPWSPWNNFGNLLQDRLDRPAEAEAAYRKAIESDAKHLQLWNNLGRVLHFRLHRYGEAEAAYRKSLELDPNGNWTWMWLGDLLSDHLGRLAEAEAAYRRAVELDPKECDSWNKLGHLLHDHLERPAEAEAAYRKAIECNSKHSLPWRNLGRVLYYELHRYGEAEAAYRKSLELDPNVNWTWKFLGDLLSDHLGRSAEAEAAYRRAIELDPKEVGTWNNLGNLLQDHLDRPAKAEAAYRRAIENDPKHAVPWGNLGRVLHYKLDRYGEAEAAYRKALELDPNANWTWIRLGDLLTDHLGRSSEAEAAYRRAIELDPKEPGSWAGLAGLLHYEHGRYLEAETAYRKALELDSGRSEAWNGLGLLLADCLGRPEDAAAAFQKAIGIDPQACLPPKYNLVSVLRDQLRRFDEARRLTAELPQKSEKANTAAILLHPALFAAYDHNWGICSEHLGQALDLIADQGAFPPHTFPGWMRATAVLLHLNYGPELLTFLQVRGDDQRLRPWYEAIRACLRGDRRYLRNIPAEMRDVAGTLYDQIGIRLQNLPASTQRWSPPSAKKRSTPRQL
jgi:tetratricopeptide (TPR) repeat protein